MTQKSTPGTTWKKILVAIGFVLFTVLIIGGFRLFSSPLQTVNLTFAYVVGLSMIVLPCTLPLVFVIVPLSIGKEPKKGLLMALAFGLGLSITLSIYGLFIGFVGQVIGLDEAINSASSVSRILFMIGGLSAFIFGLSELKLIKLELPAYRGSYPKFIQKQGDYLKAFFLGLFLGNAGVGCPNPLFYVLLGDIAIVASPLHGWWLGLIHGIGRATPLVFLSILGLLGVNAVSGLTTKAKAISSLMGVSLVVLGAVIFISGTSHEWYESTAFHRGLNSLVETVTNENIAELKEHTHEPDTPTEHAHPDELFVDNSEHEEEMKDFIPSPWAQAVLILMIIVPLAWFGIKNKE